MVTRSQLGVMDFNSGNNLLQAKIKGGQGKYNLGYSKITKQWSSKPIKVKKDKTHYFEMIDRIVEVIKTRYNFHCVNFQKIFQKILLQLRGQIKKLSLKHKNQGFQKEVTQMKFD